MSGGFFNYDCFKISSFADDLESEIGQNADTENNNWGAQRGRGFDKETLTHLESAHRIIALAGKLAKEVEWLYSDDIGSETFVKRMHEIMNKEVDR